jgi:hypothetical protein
MLRKNSILMALDIASPCSDNRQEQPPVPEREILVMIQLTRQPHYFIPLAYTLLRRLGDALRFVCLCLRPHPALAAENLFLRKQLALYQERHVIAQRTAHETRMDLT